MSANAEYGSTLPDEVSGIIGSGPDALNVVATLRTLLDRFSTPPDSNSSEQALQLLGTAVGSQSQYAQLAPELS